MMQPVSVTISVKPQDIPGLVCGDYSGKGQDAAYNALVARAIAESLGVQDFLSRPERLAELRRVLWERHPSF